jgi:DNA-binding winged helix-turn-helix (wHTH) protein/tetratricopeptide (TPR) repeat protein
MADDTYRFGEFSLSPRERRLFRGDIYVGVSPKAFDALSLLVRNHGNLVSRDEIFATLWPGIHVSEANLTNIMVMLRKMLGREAIQTISKFGYRFTLPVTGEPGIDREAYESFVRGKELLARRSADSILDARQQFWFCITRNPQFAPAWAWLGRTCRLAAKVNLQPAQPDLAEAAFQRAFALDPDLACAHHFYTQLEVDSGRAAQAMMRLSSRMRKRGEDPETLAGLVTVLRCCGLLDESLAAHRRALALNSAIQTSVAHTHFLRGDYAAVFEDYSGPGMYLDTAAWVALGDVERAASLLRTWMVQRSPGFMGTLMSSLLTVLDGQRDETLQIMQTLDQLCEPEGVFYLARHFAMIDAPEESLHAVQLARRTGFCCSYCLERDPVFSAMRERRAWIAEIEHAKRLEREAARDLRQALGPNISAELFGSLLRKEEE